MLRFVFYSFVHSYLRRLFLFCFLYENVYNQRCLPVSQKRQVVVEETEDQDPDASGGKITVGWMG